MISLGRILDFLTLVKYGTQIGSSPVEFISDAKASKVWQNIIV